MSPEIERDDAGQPRPAVVRLVDHRSSPAIVFQLANKAGSQLTRRIHRGRLPEGHKEISSERMGQLIAYMRYQGFFDFAGRVGNRPRTLPSGVRRVITLRTGEQMLLQMEDASGMASQGRRDEVVAVCEIGKAIRHISNQTLSLTVDPGGRSARDFLNQPALKHGGRGKR